MGPVGKPILEQSLFWRVVVQEVQKDVACYLHEMLTRRVMDLIGQAATSAMFQAARAFGREDKYWESELVGWKIKAIERSNQTLVLVLVAPDGEYHDLSELIESKEVTT